MSKPRVRNMEGAELLLKQLAKEIAHRIREGQTFVIKGKDYTREDLAAEVAAEAAVFEEVSRAKLALAQALLTQRARVGQTRALLATVRNALELYYGIGSPEIELFGLPAKKPRRALTSEEKVLKAERARRTRAARGTLGPRQKLAIKATGPISVVIPAVTPTRPEERPAA